MGSASRSVRARARTHTRKKRGISFRLAFSPTFEPNAMVTLTSPNSGSQWTSGGAPLTISSWLSGRHRTTTLMFSLCDRLDEDLVGDDMDDDRKAEGWLDGGREGRAGNKC